MKNQVKKIFIPMITEEILKPMAHPDGNPIRNQNGSIIIVALMVLVIMTVIALVSSDTVVTENAIIRNEGIYKQNLNMVEGALMVGFQRFMQIPIEDPANFETGADPTDWINDISDTWAGTTWYVSESSTRLLNANNSLDIDTAGSLADRSEDDFGYLRVGFIGWEPVVFATGGSESIKVSGGKKKAVWKKGRIVGEYASLGGGPRMSYGIARMEIGVKRQVPVN